jgi:hypothetical protein
MPYADFCAAVRTSFNNLSRRSDTEQISRGKLVCLPCTIAGSTLRTIDGYGLRSKLPARTALAPNIFHLQTAEHARHTTKPLGRRTLRVGTHKELPVRRLRLYDGGLMNWNSLFKNAEVFHRV